QENADLMVFDAEDGQLIGLDTSVDQQHFQADITKSEEVLVFSVEPNPKVQLSEQLVEQVQDDHFDLVAEADDTQPVDVAIPEAVIKETGDREKPDVFMTQQDEVTPTDLMPQDILKLPMQVLEGEWDLAKWEYWFRTSQLSPAVQELAQHGVMHGQINGASIFHIPQQYEGMLSQLQHGLEEALKAQWPKTQFSVEYGDVSSSTPLILQNSRKEKAFNRAVELLHQEPTIKSLVDTFDAELQNIQLKP
ncbi:DNA polymerase III subunit gamma/tau, partial [Acinetobacter haemolyticus]